MANHDTDDKISVIEKSQMDERWTFSHIEIVPKSTSNSVVPKSVVPHECHCQPKSAAAREFRKVCFPVL